ncbi:restriction endonuclease [Dyella amyloliquefaciens]|uniref:restriction endonuclease n=1 Tax=Dyella amyloliquefaciens TaxID=1770545 RepID=UPI00102EBC82|nr:restriction endonuclease [Dyella amyloliquefaciens]
MNPEATKLKAIEVFRNWEPIQEETFLDLVYGQTEALIKIPLPSHGRTNSYLDLCSDLLDASYFCETLAVEFDCGKLERKYDKYDDFFLLSVGFSDAKRLASALCRLQWVFNTPDDSSLEGVPNIVREAVIDYETMLTEKPLRYPEIVDAYLANRINGAYYECDKTDLFEEFTKYPERRFGFWRSPYFNGEASAIYVSSEAWLIPSGLTAKEAFVRYQYPEDEFSLLHADLISVDQTAAFLSERMLLTLPLRKLAEGMACMRFVEEDIMQTLWTGNTRFFVSEFKDFALVESAGMAAVFFSLTEARFESIAQTATQLFEKHRSETYSDPTIKIDWSSFDDEKFEELCYDLVYHDPRFDKATIRKMGKSRSRDGGRDIVAMTRATVVEAPRKFIFQCKAIASHRSLTTTNLGSMSDVIDQYGARGYVVMTCGYIDATVIDRLEGIASTRSLEVGTWSRFEIERFLARRPSLLARYVTPQAASRP